VVYTNGACQRSEQFGAMAGIEIWWGNDDSRFGNPTSRFKIELIPFEISQKDVLVIKRIIIIKN
ncbi:hypothetical protein M422DRAFT_189090, partial [Sphaerobolus stellatus SS14]